MRPTAPLLSPSLSLSLLLVVAACSAPEPPPAAPRMPDPPSTADAKEATLRVETFVDRVAEIEERDGFHEIAFERSARWYRIDPTRSADAAGLVARAREARATRTTVRVTVDATGTPTTKRRPRPGDPPPTLPLITTLDAD